MEQRCSASVVAVDEHPPGDELAVTHNRLRKLYATVPARVVERGHAVFVPEVQLGTLLQKNVHNSSVLLSVCLHGGKYQRGGLCCFVNLVDINLRGRDRWIILGTV